MKRRAFPDNIRDTKTLGAQFVLRHYPDNALIGTFLFQLDNLFKSYLI